jgi:hypothetical protein
MALHYSRFGRKRIDTKIDSKKDEAEKGGPV